MPLEDLFVDTDELDQELVSTVLKPYLRIDPKKLVIRPHERWKAASNKQRVVAFLLARKAMQAADLIPADAEAVSPADVIAGTGLPSGSAHPTLKDLFEARPQVVDKVGSRYLIAGWAVSAACDVLKEGS